jgi:hypothetical protein
MTEGRRKNKGEKRLNLLVCSYSTTTDNPAIRFHSTQGKIKNLPSDYGSASTQGREPKGEMYREGKGKRTIIKININQPLFPQFLLEPGLCIIENSMTTQFLQLFNL